MTYRLQRDESLPVGVRRIARELVDEAIGLLDDPGDAIEESVHQVRKNCKMLRGLVRLVRPGMGDVYGEANTTFRDAARELASIRDAHALLATFDDLVAAVGDRGPDTADAFRRVRAELAARAEAASAAVRTAAGTAGDGSHGDDGATVDARIVRARELLVAGRDGIDGWPLTNDLDVIRDGVAKTYRRGRRRLRESMFTPTDELLHQWRKRVKYTWYHVRLLRDSAPSVLKPLTGRLHDLSDVLGDDHDLAVLVDQMRADPEAFGGDEVLRQTTAVVDIVREDLQQRAWRLGSRLYVEPAGTFADRLVGYWRAWIDHGDELPAGEISDLAPPDDDLEERSVRQLNVIARELDLDGRSTMDRDQLIAAIRTTGWTEDRAAQLSARS
jgi:CHAD domain-containing protein